MSTMAPALTATLLLFLWQGAAVAAVWWMALIALRRHSPNARYLTSGVALVALAATPVVTFATLVTRSDAPPSPAELLVRAGRMAGASVAIWDTSSVLALSWLPRWTPVIWAIGVALCSFRLLGGWSAASSLRDGGAPDSGLTDMIRRLEARMGLRGPARLVISRRTDCPSVVGWLRPVVLIPAATVLGLTPPQLEAIIAHELAHIRRHDYLVNLFQVVVETVLFYHPAVWHISARMRVERELCCDDEVVRVCGDPLAYARALTVIERIRLGAPSTLALASTDGPLSYRVRRLLGLTLSPRRPMKTPALVTVGLILACSAPVIESPLQPGPPNEAAGPRTIIGLTGPVTSHHQITRTLGRPTRSSFQLDGEIKMPPPGDLATNYPAVLRALNLTGSIAVQFEVKPPGVADMRTFKVIEETDSRLTDVIRTWLPGAHFRPAEVGEYKVKLRFTR